MGFNIRASYLEYGMGLVGQFIDGELDHYELCFEKYEELPEFILSYFREDIEGYKEMLLG